VADAPLLLRDGPASAFLALAWSSQKLLLWNAGHQGHDSMPLSPTDGAMNVPNSGPVASDAKPAGLRISEDRRSWPWQASHADPEPPTGGLTTTTPSRWTTGSVLRYLDHDNAWEVA
jgi:hypothetical protein